MKLCFVKWCNRIPAKRLKILKCLSRTYLKNAPSMPPKSVASEMRKRYYFSSFCLLGQQLLITFGLGPSCLFVHVKR